MFFATTTILFGILLSLSINFEGKLPLIHLFAGILTLISPLLYIVLAKDRKKAITSLKTRMIINKFEKREKKYFAIITKVIAWIFMITLLFVVIDAILLKTGFLHLVLPNINFLEIHVKLVYFMPLLLVAHAITMKINMNYKPKKSTYKIIK